MKKWYDVHIEVEIKLTSRGYPATGPSYNSPGDPAESPEFEVGSFIVNGKEIKDNFPAIVDAIENAALDQAIEDNWEREHDEDDRDRS
jgi:hypothetical protein